MKKFIYLVCHGLLRLFIANFTKQKDSSVIDAFKYMFTIKKENLFSNAFEWTSSEENFDFWSKINENYIIHLKQKKNEVLKNR